MNLTPQFIKERLAGVNVAEIARNGAQASQPEMWAMLNARTYNNIGQWEQPTMAAAQLTIAYDSYARRLAIDRYSGLIAMTAVTLAAYRMPTYFITRNLAEAIERTTPPEGMRWTDITLPFPAGIFMLPKGYVISADGWRYNYVTWCALEKGITNLTGATAEIHQISEALLFSTSSMDDPTYSGVVKSVVANRWPWAQLPVGPVEGEPESNLESGEPAAINRLCALALGALMWMEHRPNLVSKGKCEKRITKPGSPPREYWSPNVLGAGYQSQGEGLGIGLHRQPHWRAGHWTHQFVGRREDLVKVSSLPRTADGQIDWPKVDEETRLAFWKSHTRILIEPVFVGGK